MCGISQHTLSLLLLNNSLGGIRTQTLEHFKVLLPRMHTTRDSSAGRAEDCSWNINSDILRSVVQIRLARWNVFVDAFVNTIDKKVMSRTDICKCNTHRL